MAMARSFFLSLLISLFFSHLLSLNAAPVTRIERLMHGPDQVLPTVMVDKATSLEEEILRERKTVEVNDYPGSGANNRHTPRSQFGRCVDC